MIIHWKKSLFALNEFYGSHIKEDPKIKADVHAYYYQKHPTKFDHRFTIHREVFSLCIDLHKSEEELRKEMNRTTRYQINKGSRDNLTIKVISDPDLNDIKEYAAFFDPFAKEKKIKQCRLDKLQSAALNKMLVITYVHHKDGRKLAGHAYITNQKRALMFYSCSGRFANSDIPGICVSRANRYLHWQNILYFKNLGYEIYDFMGLTIDPDNIAQQNINKFKRGFGGIETVEYQSFIPQNLKGKLLIVLLKFLWRNQMELIKNGEYPITNYLKEVNNN